MYAELIDGQWQLVTPNAFRDARPHMIIPDAAFAECGLIAVTYDTPPDIGPNDVLEGSLVDRDGLPVWAYTVRAKTPEELDGERAGMVCSRFQAKAALLMGGYLPAVEAIIAQADPLTQMAWNDAVEFRRVSTTIQTLGAALGMSETQIDDLFRGAMQIVA